MDTPGKGVPRDCVGNGGEDPVQLPPHGAAVNKLTYTDRKLNFKMGFKTQYSKWVSKPNIHNGFLYGSTIKALGRYANWKTPLIDYTTP